MDVKKIWSDKVWREEMTAQQSDALREIANKARVTTILQSKARKDTQRILKRSGLVCRERSEPFDPEKHF